MLEPIIELEAPISPTSGPGFEMSFYLAEIILVLTISNPNRKHFSESFIRQRQVLLGLEDLLGNMD